MWATVSMINSRAISGVDIRSCVGTMLWALLESLNRIHVLLAYQKDCGKVPVQASCGSHCAMCHAAGAESGDHPRRKGPIVRGKCSELRRDHPQC